MTKHRYDSKYIFMDFQTDNKAYLSLHHNYKISKQRNYKFY